MYTIEELKVQELKVSKIGQNNDIPEVVRREFLSQPLHLRTLESDSKAQQALCADLLRKFLQSIWRKLTDGGADQGYEQQSGEGTTAKPLG